MAPRTEKANNKPKKGDKKGVQKSQKLKKEIVKPYAKLFNGPKSDNFVFQNNLPHKVDLTRFIKWPKYIRLQRQRRVLTKRMRIPPALNQFTECANKPFAHRVVSFLARYAPEEAKVKKEKQEKDADAQNKTGVQPAKKAERPALAVGVNAVVRAVERKKAQLVVIAHDVTPIELVVYLPSLCNKMNVPYVIVKSKSRLGSVAHLKTCAAIALTKVKNAHKKDFAEIVESARQSFNERYENSMRQWGGNIKSKRSLIEEKKKIENIPQ